MTIDITVIMTDLKKEEIKNSKQEPLTARAVMVDSLLAVHRDEQSISGKEKFERYGLAKRISEAVDTVELTVEEVSKIKEMVAKSWAPIVVGRMYELIEK